MSYLDGHPVQKGKVKWRLGGAPDGLPLEMDFLFGGTWGHLKIEEVNRPLAAAQLAAGYYEWDYSRVYLRPGAR